MRRALLSVIAGERQQDEALADAMQIGSAVATPFLEAFGFSLQEQPSHFMSR